METQKMNSQRDTLYFFLNIFIGVQLLHNTALASVAQQSESATCIHTSPYPLRLEPPSHPPYPTALGHNKAPSCSPCAMLLLPTSYLFYIWQCIYVHATLTSPRLPPPLRVLKSILYVYVFVTALPLSSSVPFLCCCFFRFHIDALAYGICFSLSDLLHSV